MQTSMPQLPLNPRSGGGILPQFFSGVTLAWSVIKSANWATRMQRSVSGREIRVSDFQHPIWNYTLTFEVLRDGWDLRGSTYGSGPAFPIGYGPFYELDNIVQFFNSVRGAAMSFMWYDPSDGDTDKHGALTPSGGGTGVQLGVGDGVTTVWRIIGVQGSPVIPGLVRFVQPTSITYNVDPTNGLLVFNSPPAPGTAINIGMTYFQHVRFKSDTLESEEFMYQLFSMKKLELISVIGSATPSIPGT